MLVKTPYEFLVRMNKDGTIAGAHVKFLDTYTDNGVFISHTEGEAQPVSVAGSAGFPMDTILSAIQSAALVTVEVEKAKAVTSDADCVAAKAETAKVTEALAAAQVVIVSKDAEIAAQIAAQKNPTTATGMPW